MHAPLSWAILGTGNIARTFARGLAHSRTGRLRVVASRTAEKAAAFAAASGEGVRGVGSYEEALADPQVQAVYLSTPHPEHAAWAIRAAEAGKHILCEKPLTINQAEAMAVVQAAREAGVLLMEGYMYRCHPQMAKVAELLRGGAIGDLQFIEAAFAFRAGFNPESRLFANALAGGGILDVGGYPVSLARRLAGVARGQPFLNPLEVRGAGCLHPQTGIDEYATASLRFPGGILAQVTTGVSLAHDNQVRLFGTNGSLVIHQPWVPAKEGGTVLLTLRQRGEEPREIPVTTADWLYALEADAVGEAVLAGRPETAAMPVADSLGNMAALDAWRESIGLQYAAERPDAQIPPVARRALRRRDPEAIQRRALPGLEVAVSRLVMGCDNQPNLAHASVLFDHFYEHGGNAFDTAYIYGGGRQERLLGQWIRNRGLRAEVVVMVKGAHTPFCTPEHLTLQLLQSLDRLQTGHADLYLMHRDNPAVPVGEFVDVLDDHVQAGRLRLFGGSNWSIARVRAAQAYAQRKGRQGFGLLSNNFSLARMVQPVWPGCVSCSDEDSRKWLKRTQLPHFAWSSQARGFFTERAAPDRTDDPELARCWYSEDNWQRRSRAVELARVKGVQPINIALAYVLNQPFPSFALVGPRTLAETASTLPGASLPLTPAEMAWLNLERDHLRLARG